MKHLRKSILTLLALTLFGGAGAWAQGPTNVTQITTDMIASWEGVNEYVTLEDLQALGFVATDLATAQAWTGAPQSGGAYLFYAISGSNIAYVFFSAGSEDGHDNGEFVKSDLYFDVVNGFFKYFYTGAPNQAIELTKAGANQWTLGQTPDYDLELQVEYYEAHALKDIPAGWTVMVNGVPQEQPYQGDSLMITETDSVTLIPAGNPRRVKSVTLEEEVPPATPLDNTTTAWADGSFAVPEGGLTYSEAITVSGNVTLVLTDGESLTLNKGISLAAGATLTIEGNGTMNVSGTNGNASSTTDGTGTIVLTSGTLNATGGNGQSLNTNYDNTTGASGGVAINGNVTIDGGTVTAIGGNGGNCTITISGGADNIIAGNGGAAINGSVTVNAGTWTATNGSNGTANISSGSFNSRAGTGGQAVAGTVTDNR